MSHAKISKIDKKNGAVFTPSSLAQYVSEKIFNIFIEEYDFLSNQKIDTILSNLKIIDPACGEGELLLSACQTLYNIAGSLEVKKNIDPKKVLCGIDINNLSIKRTERNIQAIDTDVNKISNKFNLLTTNALFPKKGNVKFNWNKLQKHFEADNGFDILIANPPWGADTSSYAKELSESNYKLKEGQFDTSDLFVELALSIVRPGGFFAFILPDSLFGTERKKLRKLLCEKTEIKFIGRLGEKIFEGVNRACVVLICKNVPPLMSNNVSCMRLTPSFRKKILSNEISFQQADKLLSHLIPQERFISNKNYLFDIDATEEDTKIINKIVSSKTVIGDYVNSSRGVELSKMGKICRCKHCGLWSPMSNAEKMKCQHCKKEINVATAEKTKIISRKKFKGSKPLLVGESVNRYMISSRYWISTKNKGINYKDIKLYYEPKILVRKTGVGITATIDYSNSLTNQVVYIFRPKQLQKDKIVPIEFVLAIMNSRIMNYFLFKKYGETEWRSHPYLTQGQIMSLPVPVLNTRTAKNIQNQIVELLKPYLEKCIAVPEEIDAKIEKNIALLYKLNKKDYNFIYQTLYGSQQLIPLKVLTRLSVSDIFA